jgi:hypothetical protein
VAVDHGSTMETSWVAALEPALVATNRLPDDPSATIVGVYGPNPRFTVDAARGAAQIDAAAALLAERAAAVLRGGWLDPFADLRLFVERYWPERLQLAGRAGAASDGAAPAAILLTNPGPVSRYVSGLDLRIDGVDVERRRLRLRNPTVGEVGVPIPVAELGPERGFYVRRQQTAELEIGTPVAPGAHRIELRISLAGVTDSELAESVDFG